MRERKQKSISNQKNIEKFEKICKDIFKSAVFSRLSSPKMVVLMRERKQKSISNQKNIEKFEKICKDIFKTYSCNIVLIKDKLYYIIYYIYYYIIYIIILYILLYYIIKYIYYIIKYIYYYINYYYILLTNIILSFFWFFSFSL